MSAATPPVREDDRPMAQRVIVAHPPTPLTEEQRRIAEMPDPYTADVDYAAFPFLAEL